MRNQKLVRKYTQGLVNALKDEKEFKSIFSEVRDFFNLLTSQQKLKDVFVNRFLPFSKKTQIFEEIFKNKKIRGKTYRFLYLLFENDRLELLEDIIAELPDAWNEKKGISSFEVRSVIPLNENQKRRLARKLESMEKKPVVLKFKIEEDLIGGLWIKRGDIVYDVSIRGDLYSLKEKISQG
ncbi:MAG: ATP synthase F1 subunit delta [Candidatus Aminicenantes bacterium]|nr:ATP synthase F1 subunit delta [Candidatus Aminicenantes bacterium]